MRGSAEVIEYVYAKVVVWRGSANRGGPSVSVYKMKEQDKERMTLVCTYLSSIIFSIPLHYSEI